MNLFPKFVERNHVFAKLREGSDESIINVCNSIISFISNSSLRGSKPSMCVDEILMLFLEYMSLSTSYYGSGMKSVLLCIESIAKLNKKYEDCVLQTGLIGAIVDLLQKTNNKNNDNVCTEIGFIIARILSHFTTSDERSCLIFRLHHGIHSLISFIECNDTALRKRKEEYNRMMRYALNIIHHCVTHSEHAALQLFESNGLEMCLEVLSNGDMNMSDNSDSLLMKQCTDLIYAICRSNAKVRDTFITVNGFKAIIDYLCKLQHTNTPQSKANILKLLQLLSTLCIDAVCAKTLLSSGAALLSKLYPFLLSNSQINQEIKSVSAQLLRHILRYGMKDRIATQCIELYKFHETHSKIQIKRSNACAATLQAEEMECVSFPELEPLRKRKATRQQMISELECVARSMIPFVTQPPLHPWSRLLPSDLKKAKQNAEMKNRKRNKKRHSVPSNTFNKSTFAATKRRKSASFVNEYKKDLSNTRSSCALLVKTVANQRSSKLKSKVKLDESANHNNEFVTTSWIKHYYTNTTASYLERVPLLKRGEALSAPPSNLIIRLLYQQITRINHHSFTPKIVYDRNDSIYNKPQKGESTHAILEFESRFECGNLHRVIQTGPFEYDLLLSTDSNCSRHRQWFYFRVKNMKQCAEYKFNIVNLEKNDSVFNKGCKPTLYSTKRFKETGVGWTRANATNDTFYYSNAFKNSYHAKFKQVTEAMHIEKQNSARDEMHISTPQNKKKTKQKKAVSLNNSAAKRTHTKPHLLSANSLSVSPQLSKAKCLSSASSSSSLNSAPPITRSVPVQSSRGDDETIEPMTRSNYKQIRKQKARLRNKKLCETEKEKQIKNKNNNNKSNIIESMDSNYTNVLHRHNSLSFDIILPSNKRVIGGRKKRRKVPTNHDMIPSILERKKDERTDANKKYHYTLTFTIRFPHSNDTCFLSYFYPFSYSDLQGTLNVLSISPITNSLNIFRRQLLCRSRLGNRVDLLTITNLNSTMNAIRERPAVILSSRVHPGEVNASWIMKGIIDFLLSKNSVACELRNRFVFKIIPCLNPDGVICGNYRCSLGGVDLNRQYLNPSHAHHPSIFHLKRLVSTIHNDVTRKIFLICDIHGHSRMMNVTLYGCSPDPDAKHNNNNNYNSKAKFASMDYLLPNATETTDRYKLFAYLLSERAPNMFSYDECIWNITKQKEATARAVFWRQFNIQNTFTLESTFCGADLNYNVNGSHFNADHYLEIGAKFCAALYDIGSQSNESKIKIQNACNHLKSMQTHSTDHIHHNSNKNKKLKIRIRKKNSKHSKIHI